MSKTSFEKDIDTWFKIEQILNWSAKNKWFDETFVLSMKNNKTYSQAQREAIENIYNKFIGDKNEK